MVFFCCAVFLEIHNLFEKNIDVYRRGTTDDGFYERFTIVSLAKRKSCTSKIKIKKNTTVTSVSLVLYKNNKIMKTHTHIPSHTHIHMPSLLRSADGLSNTK